MFDFINSVRSKSRIHEARFVLTLDSENYTYSNLLLKSVYDLKKNTRKVKSIGDLKSLSVDKKRIQLRDSYVLSCSLFMSRFNYVHMIFSAFLTVIITNKFDSNLSNFGSLIKEPLFFEIFDSHEQFILKKFNQLRNILVHTPYIELFMDFNEDEFEELQLLCVSMIELEKQIMFIMRKNSIYSPYSHSAPIMDGVK